MHSCLTLPIGKSREHEYRDAAQEPPSHDLGQLPPIDMLDAFCEAHSNNGRNLHAIGTALLCNVSTATCPSAQTHSWCLSCFTGVTFHQTRVLAIVRMSCSAGSSGIYQGNVIAMMYCQTCIVFSSLSSLFRCSGGERYSLVQISLMQMAELTSSLSVHCTPKHVMKLCSVLICHGMLKGHTMCIAPVGKS